MARAMRARRTGSVILAVALGAAALGLTAGAAAAQSAAAAGSTTANPIVTPESGASTGVGRSPVEAGNVNGNGNVVQGTPVTGSGSGTSGVKAAEPDLSQ